MEQQQRRASILEIIGAWLHIWTPPRDAYVPPVPWRKLAIGAGIGAVVLGAVLAVMVPRINEGKESRAAIERAKDARDAARNRARINHVQRPQRGEAAALLPAADAGPAAQVAARAELLEHIEAEIMADARARSAAGEIRDVDGPTTCERTQGRPTDGPVGVFDCFTVAKTFKATKSTRSGSAGYPFRVVVDFRTYAYTWCRVEQIPGELLIQDPTQTVHLPDECQGPRA
jgi:hypothetical protein